MPLTTLYKIINRNESISLHDNTTYVRKSNDGRGGGGIYIYLHIEEGRGSNIS